jgi:hypothetical protein
MAITLGCGEECPYVPGVKYVDWPVEDPGDQDEETVLRTIADLGQESPRAVDGTRPRHRTAPSVLDQH